MCRKYSSAKVANNTSIFLQISFGYQSYRNATIAIVLSLKETEEGKLQLQAEGTVKEKTVNKSIVKEDIAKEEIVKENTGKESIIKEENIKDECFIKLKAALTPKA